MPKAALWLAALPLLALAAGPYAATGSAVEPIASVAIIIDDVGNSLRYGRRAINLPGPVACAILPRRLVRFGCDHISHGCLPVPRGY